MPLWPAFIGNTYQSRSPTLSAESCMNLMPISIESATNAKKAMLLGTPGLKPFLSVATSQCRGMFSEDGRTWTVIGPTLYELNLTAKTATSRGTIPNDGNPVSFARNGRGGEVLAIVGDGAPYLLALDTNTFSGPLSTANP